MNEMKSIAVPLKRRSADKKPRRAGHPQVAPEQLLVSGVGEARKAVRPPPVAALTTHRYRIGQRLRLVGSGRYWGRVSGVCRVLALMPHEGGPFLYRVRSEVENFERIVAEADLTTAEAP